ncbi:MAG: anthranilate synthase component I family protein [Phycisphaerae bacterium]
MARRTVSAPLSWSSRTLPPPGNRSGLRRAILEAGRGAILESVARGGPEGRYALFAVDPIRTLAPAGDPFEPLAAACRPWLRLEPPCPLPFVGGWIGYLSYEAGRHIEPTAGWDDRPLRLPLSQWTLFDTVLIHDNEVDRWTLAGVNLPRRVARRARPPIAERLDRLEALVRSANDVALRSDAGAQPTAPVRAVEPHDRPGRRFPAGARDGFRICSPGHWNLSRGAYLDRVRRALEYIRAGDIFQVNLSRRFRLEADLPPWAIYERLCRTNPAPYAACVPVASAAAGRPAAVVSSSPELFLLLRGREVLTRPIKGTRPRGETPRGDAEAAAALARSEKDRAELNMIVDLERNDLGRVCEYGSVRVAHDGEIERHPTVFHRAATVAGRLRPGLDAIDLLRATFPGGSITGAPKVRAMQIIHELEADSRGPYCGAIGFIGLDGRLCLNLGIRTLAAAGGAIDLSVGSGIVADSDPEDEYRETLAKAAGMLAALGADRDPDAIGTAKHAAVVAPPWP